MRRGHMREDGIRPAGQERSVQAPELSHHRSHLIDPAMHRGQPTVGQARLDLMASQPRAQQLRARSNPVLPARSATEQLCRCERRKYSVGGVRRVVLRLTVQ